MKTNVKELKQEIAKLNTPANKRYLNHLLSPIEQALLRHAFQPFRYKIDGVFIYISATACKKLLVGLIHRIQLMNHLVDKDKQSLNIPFKLRETFDDPAVILSLNPVLRNRLCKVELYNMFAIMQKGRAYFMAQKFGEAALKKLDQLFAKHGCVNLFK